MKKEMKNEVLLVVMCVLGSLYLLTHGFLAGTAWCWVLIIIVALKHTRWAW